MPSGVAVAAWLTRLLLTSGVLLPILAGCSGGRSERSSNAEEPKIVAIVVRPYDAGPSPLTATAHGSPARTGGTAVRLRDVQSAIPDPLPSPLPQFPCRVMAQNVEIRLHGGRTLFYGPCAFPDSILRLRQEMLRVAARRGKTEPARVRHRVLVPKLVGVEALVATRRLLRLGLRPRWVPCPFRHDRVYGQNPMGGNRVRLRAIVWLVPRSASMPVRDRTPRPECWGGGRFRRR